MGCQRKTQMHLWLLSRRLRRLIFAPPKLASLRQGSALAYESCLSRGSVLWPMLQCQSLLAGIGIPGAPAQEAELEGDPVTRVERAQLCA